MERHPVEIPDLREKGAVCDGGPAASDRRLFMLLQAFGGCGDPGTATQAAASLTQAGVEGALYADLHDPRGLAVLTIAEDPGFFTDTLRAVLNRPPFAALTLKPRYTMAGRTYAVGYETDLDEALLKRPRRTALNPAWPWAVWYPLRRSGAFQRLDPQQQRAVLGEHGGIGQSFAAGDLAHDVRLACFGLGPRDNDFVVALMGKDLFPLSACVQAMRKTRQTAEFIEHMGPFFVGRAVWQAPCKV
jgi:chlorite dismutase